MIELELRPYQRECVDSVQTHLAKGINKQLCVLATGSGKTIIFGAVAKVMDCPTLILTHRDELIQQTEEKVKYVWNNADIGVVKAERNELDRQVIVASVPTLAPIPFK